MSADNCLIAAEQDWQLYQLLPQNEVKWREKIYQEVNAHVAESFGYSHGREYTYPRYSVIVTSCQSSAIVKDRKCVQMGKLNNEQVNYYGIPVVNWHLLPMVKQIKIHLENYLPACRIDYCLAHLYSGPSSGKYAGRGGAHYISWHADREALDPDTSVYSLSLGATRKFRLRQIGRTNGWDYEYELQHGQLLWMKPGCQRRWQHCVPKQLKVYDWRINLTFRANK